MLSEHGRRRVELRKNATQYFAGALGCYLRGLDVWANDWLTEAVPTAKEYEVLAKCKCVECRKEMCRTVVIGNAAIGLASAMLLRAVIRS